MTANVKTHGSDLVWFEDIVSDPTLVGGQVAVYNKGGDFTIKDDDGIVSSVKDVYGSMYSEHAAEVITVVASDTYYEITGGFTTGSPLQGCTFGGAHYVEVDHAGTYLINWTLSLYSGVNNQVLAGAVMINGVKRDEGTAHSVTGALSDAVSMSGTLILVLSADDEVSLAVSDETAANDITMAHGGLTVVRIGE